MNSDIMDKLVSLLEPAVSLEGCKLFDIDFRQGKGTGLLRVYIDKDGGVGVEDCARVSRQVGLLLDVEDIIPGSYTLEVSSPGLTRKLKKPSDFEKSIGKLVAVGARKQAGGGKGGKFTGILENAGEKSILLKLKDGAAVELLHADITKANLEIE